MDNGRGYADDCSVCMCIIYILHIIHILIFVLGLTINYTNGDSCNGKPRQSFIIVTCGTSTSILAQSESPLCVYYITMVSPAACPTNAASAINTFSSS